MLYNSQPFAFRGGSATHERVNFMGLVHDRIE